MVGYWNNPKVLGSSLSRIVLSCPSFCGNCIAEYLLTRLRPQQKRLTARDGTCHIEFHQRRAADSGACSFRLHTGDICYVDDKGL
jgi:hypothetical protein